MTDGAPQGRRLALVPAQALRVMSYLPMGLEATGEAWMDVLMGRRNLLGQEVATGLSQEVVLLVLVWPGARQWVSNVFKLLLEFQVV
jgi:hypothetical protein